jgi:hypothetical protein
VRTRRVVRYAERRIPAIRWSSKEIVMRRSWRLAAVVGMVTFAFAGSFSAQQPAAPSPAAPAAAPAQTPAPAVYQPNALAGEKDFVVGVQPPFVWGPLENPKPNVPEGFTPIFNGENPAGWHTSRINRHGKTPDFRAIDGVIVGTQSPFGEGGILLTDKSYRNFEFYVEVRPDYGCDSGFFFRSTEAGHAYQVTMDYLPGGSMGALITENPDRSNTPARQTRAGGAAAPPARAGGAGRGPAPRVVGGIPLGQTTPVGEAAWMKAWKREAWNSVRVRVEGDIPHVQVWINDQLVTDAHETTNRAEGGIVDGPIAIQIHGGSRWVPAGFWRWRNLGIKELP